MFLAIGNPWAGQTGGINIASAPYGRANGGINIAFGKFQTFSKHCFLGWVPRCSPLIDTVPWTGIEYIAHSIWPPRRAGSKVGSMTLSCSSRKADALIFTNTVPANPLAVHVYKSWNLNLLTAACHSLSQHTPPPHTTNRNFVCNQWTTA